MAISFRGISVKLAAFIIVLLVCTTIMFSLVTVEIMNDSIITEVTRRAESLCKSTAVSAGYSIISKDALGIDNVVFKVKEAHRDIDYIAVLSRSAKIIAHNDVKKRGTKFKFSESAVIKKGSDGTVVRTNSDAAKTLFEVVTPVIYHNKKLGSVVLGVNKSILVSAQTKARNRILIWFSLMMLVGVIGIFILAQRLVRPIKELSAGVDLLKQGKSSALRIYSRDELGKLTESFNEMSTRILNQQDKLARSAAELEESYIATVRVLTAAIDARDQYTMGHSTRVAKLSVMIAEALGMTRSEIDDLEIACLFHDVGKIKTPDAVLLKDERLNDQEIRIIMQHPDDGADILSRAPSLHKYMSVVKHHHEWFNGTGYPDGLRSGDIPLSAAVVAIADAFDAMTSKRPYRDALSEETAIDELRTFSECQFHPDIVKIFIQELDKKRTVGTFSPGTGVTG